MSLSNLSSSNSNGAFLDYGEFRSGVYIQTSNQILYFTDENGNKVGYQWKGLLPHTTTTNDPNTDGGISDTAWCSIVGSGFIEKLSKEGIDLSWKAHLPTVEVSYNLPHKSLKIWEEGTISTDNDYWLYPGDGTVWNGVGVLGSIPDVPFKQIVPQNNVIEWSAIATEGQNQFTVPYEFTNISVFINGLLQNKSTGGYMVNGSTVTLNGSLKAGDDIHVVISNIPIKNINYITDVELSQPDTANKIGLLHGGKVQDLQKFLSFDMFNIDKTGSTDVTSKIENVFSIANNFGLEVIQNDGVYLISGNFSIPVKYGFDLSGAKFLLAANTTGQFLISQSKKPTTYDSTSALVTAMNAKASTDFVAGNGILTSLKDSTVLNNSMLFMLGADDLLQYTGNASPTKWRHVSNLYHYGLLAVPFKYGVSALTSVYSLPIADSVTVCKLPIIDLQNNPHTILFAFNGITRYEIHEGTCINKAQSQVGIFHMASLTNYSLVNIYVMRDTHPTVSYSDAGMTQQAASYTLNYGRGTDLTVYHSGSQGYGWGATGGGDIIANTRFLYSNFNRFDSHNPILGYFDAIDCTFGVGGLAVAGFGTINIVRPRFSRNPNSNDPFGGNLPMYFRIRETHGGWFDGSLNITDMVVDGVDTILPNFVEAPQISDTQLPAGSPVQPWAFKHIYIDGLEFTTPKVGRRLNKFHSHSGPYSSGTYHPKSIIIKRLKYNCQGSADPEQDALVFDITNAKQQTFNTAANHVAIEPATTEIVLEDCEVASLVFKRSAIAASHCVDVTLVRLSPSQPDGDYPVIHTNLKGRYKAIDSKIGGFDDSAFGVPTAHTLMFDQVSCINKHKGTDLPYKLAGGYPHDFTSVGTTFIGNYSRAEVTAQNTNLGQWSSLDGCKYYTKEGGITTHLMMWSGNIGSTQTDINISIHDGNTLLSSLILDSKIIFDEMRLCNVTGIVGRQLYNPSSGGYYYNVARNGHRVNINSGAGSASIREIHVK
ncbi:hypothetical protein DIDNDMLP_00444 [Klebsiella phage KP13-7]|nr:hypothetical protein DIDNDMLP_00444 [Klebsiella phage KP13-7]